VTNLAGMEELFTLLMCITAIVLNVIIIGIFLLTSIIRSLNRKSEKITLMSRKVRRWEIWKKQKLEDYDRIENETSHQKDCML
jgi:competence protein ComGF